jgi:hypothetical protein
MNPLEGFVAHSHRTSHCLRTFSCKVCYHLSNKHQVCYNHATKNAVSMKEHFMKEYFMKEYKGCVMRRLPDDKKKGIALNCGSDF